mgnify:FL=1
MAVLFLLLATGFIARKTGVIDDAASKRLSKLIVNIGQPMMIIHALIKIEYSAEKTREGLIMLVLGLGLHLFMSVFAFFASRGIKDADERKISEFSMLFGNVGFIGFPILRSIFGDIGEFWGSFFVIGFHLFVWTWGIAILARGRKDIKLTPKKVFLNFGTVPCFIGVLLYFLMKWIEIPSVIVTYTGYLNNLCTPISVLIVGALLATRKPKQIFGDGKTYYVCFCKLIAIPILVCVIETLLGLPEYIILFSTAVSAMPSATNVTMFAELYDIKPGYASQTVGVTSLFTIVTLPLMMLAANFIIGLIR